MQLTIFDDDRIDAFYPITFSRVVGDLRCGILKQRQRISHHFESDNDSYLMDDSYCALYKLKHPDWSINESNSGLFVNSSLRVSSEAMAQIESLVDESAILAGDRVVALKTKQKIRSFPDLATLAPQLDQIYPDTETRLYSNLADLIHDNPRMIDWDYKECFYDADNFFETEPGVSVLDPYQVWIGEDAELKPGVVIDASSGPVVIDSGVCIMPNAVILGPAYIGKRSTIKVGAKIYPGTSIGPVCKIGGEVEGSIFQAYSNKQHDGFLGHAYVGEWVNIGADTNNSDLKNNYRAVSFYSYHRGEKIDSGSMFLGCIIGDHTKLGINCSINTGCVIGCGSNLWGKDLISDFIPDFSWGEAESLTKYRLPAFLETAELVKQRRNLHLTTEEKDLYTRIHGK